MKEGGAFDTAVLLGFRHQLKRILSTYRKDLSAEAEALGINCFKAGLQTLNEGGMSE